MRVVERAKAKERAKERMKGKERAGPGGAGTLGAGNGYVGEGSWTLFPPGQTRSSHCDPVKLNYDRPERSVCARTLDRWAD